MLIRTVCNWANTPPWLHLFHLQDGLCRVRRSHAAEPHDVPGLRGGPPDCVQKKKKKAENE